jgi:hypothetical protein
MENYDDKYTTPNNKVVNEKNDTADHIVAVTPDDYIIFRKEKEAAKYRSTVLYVLATTVAVAAIIVSLFALFTTQNNKAPETIPTGDINIELPETPETPEVKVPKVELPEIKVPEVKIETPEVNIPEIKVPETKSPEADTSKVNTDVKAD